MSRRPVTALRLPPLLAPGARVQVIAPSGVFDRAKLESGLQVLRQAGLAPAVGEGAFARQRYLAGDDRRRRDELLAALHEPAVAALWIARGGYGATRLLPDLPLADLAAHPKWLVGFSDATALHARWQAAGLASLHGPNLTTLADWGAAALADLFARLCAGHGAPVVGETWHPGPVVEGPLVGGNLTVLGALAGTGFWPSRQGCVVFLEDVGEQTYRLDRTLTHLLQAGFFAGCLGVAVGQLTDCRPPEGADYGADDVVRERLGVLGVPVVGRLPIGHEPSSYAVTLGAWTRLDAGRGALEPARPARSHTMSP